MLDDNTVNLLGAFLNSSPEERKEYWKGLEKFCEDNGYEKGFYCPYIPLQIISVKNNEKDKI